MGMYAGMSRGLQLRQAQDQIALENQRRAEQEAAQGLQRQFENARQTAGDQRAAESQASEIGYRGLMSKKVTADMDKDALYAENVKQAKLLHEKADFNEALFNPAADPRDYPNAVQEFRSRYKGFQPNKDGTLTLMNADGSTKVVSQEDAKRRAEQLRDQAAQLLEPGAYAKRTAQTDAAKELATYKAGLPPRERSLSGTERAALASKQQAEEIGLVGLRRQKKTAEADLERASGLKSKKHWGRNNDEQSVEDIAAVTAARGLVDDLDAKIKLAESLRDIQKAIQAEDAPVPEQRGLPPNVNRELLGDMIIKAQQAGAMGHDAAMQKETKGLAVQSATPARQGVMNQKEFVADFMAVKGREPTQAQIDMAWAKGYWR